MNPMIQLKKLRPLIVTVLSLACFGLAQAVVPPPDGGYPGGNTAEGTNALLSLTTGQNNTAVGVNSLSSTTTGGLNTAIGPGALRFNTTGDSNTAIGSAALRFNTASNNTAVGSNALFSNRFGHYNTAVGDSSLYSSTIGEENTAVGWEAMYFNTTGFSNTAVGEGALLRNTQGGPNTAIGAGALEFNTTGFNNTALGHFAGLNVNTAHDVICIGDLGADVSNTCFIGSIRGVTTIHNNALPVYIDSSGQLGTASSSRRFKRDIKPIGNASEGLLALKPVSFAYKAHKDSTPQFGLLAEDVADVNPDLVIYDTDGKPFAVRYDSVNAMLLNEFLKEHRKVEKLEGLVAQQRKDFEAALTDLKGQIQKVSAQLELNESAPHVAENNQ